MKVGIVDSGINGCILKHPVIYRKCIKDTDKSIDKNGHGTMCAYVIEKYSGCDIDFFSYKIFDEELTSTEEAIVSALQMSLEDGVEVLNLSLSIHLGFSKKIDILLNKLNNNGIRVISSCSKYGIKTLMDKEENVEVVRGLDLYNDRFRVYKDGVICDGAPIVARWNYDDFDFFGGNSKATALYTALSLRGGTDGVGRRVIPNANNHSFKPSDYYRHCIMEKVSDYTGVNLQKISKEENWEIFGDQFFDRLILLLKDYLGIDKLNKYTIYYNDMKTPSMFINIMSRGDI